MNTKKLLVYTGLALFGLVLIVPLRVILTGHIVTADEAGACSVIAGLAFAAIVAGAGTEPEDWPR